MSFMDYLKGGPLSRGVKQAGKNFDMPKLNEIYRSGQDTSASGTALTDEGLGGLRDLDKKYQGLIASGGLTPELKRQFDVARGYLSDQYTRSSRSLSAALASRRAQTGGALTPGAVAEMEKQSGATRDEQYFGASNDLAGKQATMGYESTKDLYSRIENIRGTITQTGLTREQQGLLARLHAAGLMLDRRKAVASFGMSGLMGGSV